MDILPDIKRQPPVLSEQENKVYNILNDLSEGSNQFGKWYLGALTVLRSDNEDSLAQAANSLREIADKLPTILGASPYQSPVPAASEVAIEILKIRDKNYTDGWKDKVISAKLAKQLERMEALRTLKNAVPRQRRLGVALSKNDSNAVLQAEGLRASRDKAFADTIAYFEKVTHHKLTPNKQEFLTKLFDFERLIISYLSPVTAEQQKEILNIIGNPPNEDSEKRMEWLITHNASNLLFFFRKLGDPKWLPFIKRIGHLDYTARNEEKSSGRYDPAFDTLVNLAPLAPEDVLKILESIPKKSKTVSLDAVMRCISPIKAIELIPRCAKVISKLMPSDSAHHYPFLDDVLDVWVSLGCYEEVVQILSKYLCSLMLSKNEYDPMIEYAFQTIDQKYLGPLATGREKDFSELTFYALKFWKKIQSQKHKSILPFWFQSFRQPIYSINKDAGILSVRLFETGRAIFSRLGKSEIEEFDKLLRSDQWELFDRLRWQLYAEFPEQTLEYAKADMIDRIPMLNSYNGSHGYEVAQLLTKHVEIHGKDFLDHEAVENFFNQIMSGPVDKDQLLEIDEDMKRRFWRKQLQPIAPLLNPAQKAVYDDLIKDFSGEIKPENYMPFRSGRSYSVKSVSPITAEELAKMKNDELFDFLEEWTPTGSYREIGEEAMEATVNELGRELANLVAAKPERFPATTEWWKHIKRPEILTKLLEAANMIIAPEKDTSEPFREPSADQWQVWFGLVDWILELSNDDSSAALDQYKQNVWNWPRRVVVQFLNHVIQSKMAIPEGFEQRIAVTLETILLNKDVTENVQEIPSFGDWLTVAINSVKGTALEALIALGVRQKKFKKGQPESWIFEMITKILNQAGASPSLFAIMGANLPAVIYLFAEEIKKQPEIVMPKERHECTEAFITSQIKYGRWTNDILTVFPDYPDLALDLLLKTNLEPKVGRGSRDDYGGHLGLHLCFYFWNDMYGTSERGVRIMKRFFRVSNPLQRAETFGEISRIFKNEKSSEDLTQMLDRLKEIWELRIQDIENNQKSEESSDENLRGEIGSFLRWIEIQAMDFKWRHEQIIRALKLCKKAPEHLIYIRDLLNEHTEPGELKGRLEIFKHILQLSNDSNTWYYRDKELIPVLKSALNSEDPETQQHSKEVQEILLRRGCFEFLMDEEGPESE